MYVGYIFTLPPRNSICGLGISPPYTLGESKTITLYKKNFFVLLSLMLIIELCFEPINKGETSKARAPEKT